jgi:hypothetical protein
MSVAEFFEANEDLRLGVAIRYGSLLRQVVSHDPGVYSGVRAKRQIRAQMECAMVLQSGCA